MHASHVVVDTKDGYMFTAGAASVQACLKIDQDNARAVAAYRRGAPQ